MGFPEMLHFQQAQLPGKAHTASSQLTVADARVSLAQPGQGQCEHLCLCTNGLLPVHRARIKTGSGLLETL